MDTVIAGMTSLLSLGFGYVTQGAEDAPTSNIVALLDRDRAALPLDGVEEFLSDRRRRDRLKDVGRAWDLAWAQICSRSTRDRLRTRPGIDLGFGEANLDDPQEGQVGPRPPSGLVNRERSPMGP